MPDVLEAGPLTLVRWRPQAVDEVLEAVRSSFAELQQWMHWAQTMPTRAQQRAALAAGAIAFDAGTEFGYLFREKSTGAVVGGGGLHRRIGPDAIEIGYWVRTDRHRRGYATIATETMTDAAFTHLADVDRVEIHMDCSNLASARIPEKLGYRTHSDGTVREGCTRPHRHAVHLGDAPATSGRHADRTTASRPVDPVRRCSPFRAGGQGCAAGSAEGGVVETELTFRRLDRGRVVDDDQFDAGHRREVADRCEC